MGGYAGIGYAAPIAVAKSAPCVNAANIPVPCNGGALSLEASGSVRLRPRLSPPTWLPALAMLDLAMLLPLPLPFFLDTSGSVRPRLRLPTCLLVMQVLAMPILVLGMPDMPPPLVVHSCGKFFL